MVYARRLLSLRFSAGHVAGRQLLFVFLTHPVESLESAASCCCVRLESVVFLLGRLYQSRVRAAGWAATCNRASAATITSARPHST